MMSHSAAQSLLHRWHDQMQSSDMSKLESLLAEDVVFHSPVVHSPQKGREIVCLYLRAANNIFSDTQFQYVREVVDGPNIVLEFTCLMDGIFVNGIDMIHVNDDGLIDDFKVMVRPIKAVNLVWERMGEMLAQKKSA